jgi:hypothetical protein
MIDRQRVVFLPGLFHVLFDELVDALDERVLSRSSTGCSRHAGLRPRLCLCL